MSGAFPAVRPSAGGTDLVAEMQQRRQNLSEAAQTRAQQMRRRSVVVSIVMLISLVVLVVVGKVAFDEYRVHRILEAAHAQIDEGTPEALDLAVFSIERVLQLEPGHAEGTAAMALVRAQQAIDGDVSLDEAEAAIAAAGDSTESIVGGGIVAVLRGDFEGAKQILPEAEELSGPDAGPLRRAQAWVQAQIALNELDESSALTPAIEAVEAALAQAPGWDRNYRSAAALYFQSGRIDQALERVKMGQALRPSDPGLLVDQALYQAVLSHDLDAVRQMLSSPLMGAPGLGARDGSRAQLAYALAKLQQKGTPSAQQELADAYQGLTEYDSFARTMAFDVALTTGASALAKRWLEAEPLTPTTRKIYEAWVEFAEDQVSDSLQHLATLPQSRPRVALVQGLALVEQERWEEAGPWLGRAQESLAHLPVLDVAMARVDAQRGDPTDAVTRLTQLCERYPRTPRVWTGLAEALIQATGDKSIPDSAQEALQRAVETEAFPAQAAYLLAQRRQAQALEDPGKAKEAIAMFRKAEQLRPEVPIYREALGRYLADVGDRNEARELLTQVADRAADPHTLLIVSELTAEFASARGEVPPSQIVTWITTAGQRGVPTAAVARTNARIALMAGTPDGVVQARTWIEPLLQANRRDLEARLIEVEVLRREQNIDGARASLRTGMRVTPRAQQGRLLLAWSLVESDAGKARRAASLAYKGWRSALEEPRPANELLEIAQRGATRWLAVENTSGARSIGRSLTHHVPFRAESWVLRAKILRDAKFFEESCESADQAIELDDTLVSAYRALADCKSALNQSDAARAALERAAELSTNRAEAKVLRRRARKLR